MSAHRGLINASRAGPSRILSTRECRTRSAIRSRPRRESITQFRRAFTLCLVSRAVGLENRWSAAREGVNGAGICRRPQ